MDTPSPDQSANHSIYYIDPSPQSSLPPYNSPSCQRLNHPHSSFPSEESANVNSFPTQSCSRNDTSVMTQNRRPIISQIATSERNDHSSNATYGQLSSKHEFRQTTNIEESTSFRDMSTDNLKDLLSVKKWFPRVVVIGPGGAKGFKVLGFMSPVEDSGLLEYVDTYCGVSVGAVISLLIICGYQIREIVGEAVKLDIFKEIGEFNFQSIMENNGFISTEPLRKLLTQLVINKLGNVPSLYSLYMRTGKAFIAVTLNATDEVCVMLNPWSHPDISCVDATMFSMNIPFVFYQLVYRGKTYVDGALANPYPVDYFDDGKTNILGIYMKTAPSKNITPITTHLPGSIVQRIENPSTPLPIGSYSLKIIHSLIDHRRNQIIQESSNCCRHVCLETKSVNAIGYNVTSEDKAMLLVEGFNEGKSFLSQLYSGTYKGPDIPEKQTYTYPPYFMTEESIPSSIDESHDDNIEILSSMLDS